MQPPQPCNAHRLNLKCAPLFSVKPCSLKRSLTNLLRSYYQDPDTNERLSTWLNPLNNATVTVVHVSNDPVNNPVFGPLPVVNVGGNTQVSQRWGVSKRSRVTRARGADDCCRFCRWMSR